MKHVVNPRRTKRRRENQFQNLEHELLEKKVRD